MVAPLSMHLDDEGIEKTLHSFIARKVARRIKSDTLIIVDPSDIQKPYATHMDFLSKAWDGSKGAVGDNLGYYGCMAVACENGGRKPMPLHLRFWSPDAPGFTSENDEVAEASADFGFENGWVQDMSAADPTLALLGENMTAGHGPVAASRD